MRRHIVYALGLALALPCAGAWAFQTPNAGNGTGAGTELQTPAPANPNAPAPQNQAQPNAPAPDQSQPPAATPDQTQPNPGQPNAAPANPVTPNQEQPNPAPPNQLQPNQEQPNPAAPNQPQANPAPPAPEAPNAAPLNQEQPAPAAASVPGQPVPATTPTYFSPLQHFASDNVNEIGELSSQMTQFQAANRPDAVMVLYHMIRDHRLAADAAENILARRGDVSTPTIVVMQPMPTTPADILRQDIQEHQQMASTLQPMIANANTDADKNLYQQALNITNKHLQWLQSLDQGQQVQVGFFDPTTPLGALAGTTTVAAAGYPQPTITQRTAGFRQQATTRHRRMRRTRYTRHRRTRRYRRTSSYGY